MNNKIHDKTHTTLQKDTKIRITQVKLTQKNKTKNCP